MINQGKTRHLQQMRQEKRVLYYQLRPENNYSNVDYIYISMEHLWVHSGGVVLQQDTRSEGLLPTIHWTTNSQKY